MADNKISIKGLYKVFGDSPNDVIQNIINGMSKEKLLSEHGSVLGLNNINIDIPRKHDHSYAIDLSKKYYFYGLQG